MPKNRIVFAAALIILPLVGFIATSLGSYLLAHQSLSERISEDSLPLTSDNIYSEIERDLLRSVLISSLMAHDTFVREWVRGGEKEPERIRRYLAQIQRKYDTTTAFFVSEQTRRYYHPDGVLKTVSRGDEQDAWYFRVRDSNAPYEINIDRDTADPERISIFVNYRVMGAEGSLLGVTGIGLSVKTVARLIENYRERYGRSVYFIDRQGRVTIGGEAFTGPERIQERDGLARHATRILANPSAAVSYTSGNGRVFVNTRLIPELDWYLVVEQSKTAAESRLLGALIVNLALALAVTVLVIGLGYFLLRGYQRRLEAMATTDKLTGAANRQVFDMLFEHAARLAERKHTPLSLVSVDLDHFKAINDSHGHQAGDLVLRGFADIVCGRIRESDTLCRWGGDEFLVLLEDSDADDALRTAERIREAVHERPIAYAGKRIAFSVSMGVAQYHRGENLESLVARADEALYEAKQAGRDQVGRSGSGQ